MWTSLQLAAEKYEEGERALKKAKHVEAEHESRLRNIHLQTDQLRQQEKRILQVPITQGQIYQLQQHTINSVLFHTGAKAVKPSAGGRAAETGHHLHTTHHPPCITR